MDERNLRCQEAQELITGLIDGELSSEESSLIQSHLYACPDCPGIYQREFALKHLMRRAALTVNAPPDLRKRIGRYQRESVGRFRFKLGESLPRAAHFAARATVFVALLAIPVLTARYWLSSPYLPIVSGIFQSYRQITQGEVVPASITNPSELKIRLTQLVDGQFAPMAYDFSTMNIHLVGGLVQKIANRNVLVAVYKGIGATIVCYTFLGSEGDAPEIAELFFDSEKEMNFYQFFYTETNAVMHREGNIICVLMGQIPKDELLALARAKAHAT